MLHLSFASLAVGAHPTLFAMVRMEMLTAEDGGEEDLAWEPSPAARRKGRSSLQKNAETASATSTLLATTSKASSRNLPSPQRPRMPETSHRSLQQGHGADSKPELASSSASQEAVPACGMMASRAQAWPGKEPSDHPAQDRLRHKTGPISQHIPAAAEFRPDSSSKEQWGIQPGHTSDRWTALGRASEASQAMPSGSGAITAHSSQKSPALTESTGRQEPSIETEQILRDLGVITLADKGETLYLHDKEGSPKPPLWHVSSSRLDHAESALLPRPQQCLRPWPLHHLPAPYLRDAHFHSPHYSVFSGPSSPASRSFLLDCIQRLSIFHFSNGGRASIGLLLVRGIFR